MSVRIELPGMNIESAVSELTSAESQMRDDPPDSIADKDEALGEYQSLFQPDEVANLPEERLKEFLRYENNRHWTGLHRQEGKLTEDMDQLRTALQTLVDTDKDLASRVTEVKDTIHGMGKATLSAILLTAYPEDYGVWNNRSEEALKQLDVWPEFETGAEFGERYTEVNAVLRDLSDELEIDHWTLMHSLATSLRMIWYSRNPSSKTRHKRVSLSKKNTCNSISSTTGTTSNSHRTGRSIAIQTTQRQA